MVTRSFRSPSRELEEETGFDRRTIAYYVQEGLLPRVGRRGPRTRYPGLVRDRLVFIRRVREAEEAGRVPAVSLSDMRKVFERVPPALVARVADGEIAVTPELVERASTGFRPPGMRRAVLEDRVRSWEVRAGEPRLRAPVASPPPQDRPLREEPAPGPMDAHVVRDSGPGGPLDRAATEEDPGDALRELRDRARERILRSRSPMDRWTRIGITPEIELSVRGLDDEDAGLVERVRRAMRRLVGEPGAE